RSGAGMIAGSEASRRLEESALRDRGHAAPARRDVQLLNAGPFTAASPRIERASDAVSSAAPIPLNQPSGAKRPSVHGKFLAAGGRKLYVRGVTYGAFRPDAAGREYHDLDVIDRDFGQMAASGFNAVRIPHTMPPRALLDAAERHRLWVMVGLSAEQLIGYIIDRRRYVNLVLLLR